MIWATDPVDFDKSNLNFKMFSFDFWNIQSPQDHSETQMILVTAVGLREMVFSVKGCRLKPAQG